MTANEQDPVVVAGQEPAAAGQQAGVSPEPVPLPEPVQTVTVRYLPGASAVVMRSQVITLIVLAVVMVALAGLAGLVLAARVSIAALGLALLSMATVVLCVVGLLRIRRSNKVRDAGAPYLVLDREGITVDNREGTLRLPWWLVTSASWEPRVRRRALVLRLDPRLTAATPGVVSSVRGQELGLYRRRGIPIVGGLTDPSADRVAEAVSRFTDGRLSPGS